MLNNFIQYQYQPYHKIFTNPTTSYSIYLGDVSAALDLQFITNQPIHLVVTAASGMDQVVYHNNQVKHIVYPLLDAKSQNIAQFFTQFFDLVQKQIHHGNILVHCAAGISRSATLVISYFMKKNNWTFKEAVKFVRDKRPIILPNLGFERQLKEFQNLLNRQTYTSQFQNRCLQTNDEERKNLFSPVRRDPLPDIKNLGQTAFLRSKPLQKTINLRLDPEQVRQFAHKKFGQRMRKSQPDNKGLKKKVMHFGNLNKQLIYAKIQSGRSKLLQRSNNESNNYIFMNFPTDNSTFYDEPNLSKTKKLSSLSHRSEKKNRQPKLVRNYSNNKHAKNQSQIEQLNRVIVSKLHLNERKFATQKNLRTRGIQRLAQL